MMGVANSYTLEASFAGSTLGSRMDTHFNVQDFENMGRAFCETLIDFCDEEPSKVCSVCNRFTGIVFAKLILLCNLFHFCYF